MVQAVQKFFADQERQGKVRRAPDQSYYLTETGARPTRTSALIPFASRLLFRIFLLKTRVRTPEGDPERCPPRQNSRAVCLNEKEQLLLN